VRSICSRVLRYARVAERQCRDVAADLIGLLVPAEAEPTLPSSHILGTIISNNEVCHYYAPSCCSEPNPSASRKSTGSCYQYSSQAGRGLDGRRAFRAARIFYMKGAGERVSGAGVSRVIIVWTHGKRRAATEQHGG
jgi:hypothetical protein